MSVKNRTVEFWAASGKYYDSAKSENKPLSDNPALIKILENIESGHKVLDVGCGEGSKIIDAFNRVPGINAHGIDVSTIAIERARKRESRIQFVCHDIEKLPFKDNSFDTTFSTYVFEHTISPEKILEEMIRVTKKGGKVIIVCPNYGSPIYPSPITPKGKHLIRGFLRDIKYIFRKPKKLEWYPEKPILDGRWRPDYDTTILPYAYSLKILFPEARVSSTWRGIETGGYWWLKILRTPFKFMGILEIFPFKWWGSTLYFELKIDK